MFVCWFWWDVAFYQMVACKFLDRESKAPDLNGLRLQTLETRQVHNVWSWLEINVSCHQRCSLLRCDCEGMAGWRDVWIWGETMIIAPDIADANLIWMVCFVKGVLPRRLHSDYSLRVNRYSVHTLPIAQLLFLVWAVILACIHHYHYHQLPPWTAPLPLGFLTHWRINRWYYNHFLVLLCVCKYFKNITNMMIYDVYTIDI